LVCCTIGSEDQTWSTHSVAFNKTDIIQILQYIVGRRAEKLDESTGHDPYLK